MKMAEVEEVKAMTEVEVMTGAVLAREQTAIVGGIRGIFPCQIDKAYTLDSTRVESDAL